MCSWTKTLGLGWNILKNIPRYLSIVGRHKSLLGRLQTSENGHLIEGILILVKPTFSNLQNMKNKCFDSSSRKRKLRILFWNQPVSYHSWQVIWPFQKYHTTSARSWSLAILKLPLLWVRLTWIFSAGWLAGKVEAASLPEERERDSS